MNKVLTPEQIDEYYASESSRGYPLSPLDWLAQQNPASKDETITDETGDVISTAPYKSPDGATSSASPMLNKNTEQAKQQAAGALGTDSTSWMDWYKENIVDPSMSLAKETLEETQDIIELQYDVQKEQSNFFYKNAISDLRDNFGKATEAAEANAAALNPYSEARGASTAKNFKAAIKDKFQKAETRLRGQADLAMQALLTGEETAFRKAQQGMNATIQSVNKEAHTAILDMMKEERQANQFQMNYDLNKESVDLQKANQAQDNFVDALTDLPLGDISNMSDEDLSTSFGKVFDLGKEMGMTEDEVKNYVRQTAKIQGQELEDAELDRAYKRALINQANRSGQDTGGDTVAERKASAVSEFSSKFVQGAKLSDGTPVLTPQGAVTPEAWRSAIADAPQMGLTRADFIQEFGYLLDSEDYDQYGLTPTEEKIITGEI